MKKYALLIATTIVVGSILGSGPAQPKEHEHGAVSDMSQPHFVNFADIKWEKMMPEMGKDSPEICILHVDPKSGATKLFIRVPTTLHVRKHWHSHNETHTIIFGKQTYACEGKKIEQEPGSFNYMPAKMVHEAWIPAGSLVFITVDGPWDVNWVEGPPTAQDLTK